MFATVTEPSFDGVKDQDSSEINKPNNQNERIYVILICNWKQSVLELMFLMHIR